MYFLSHLSIIIILENEDVITSLGFFIFSLCSEGTKLLSLPSIRVEEKESSKN